MLILALDLLHSGVPLALLCALIGLGFAFFLIRKILRCFAGQ